MNRSSNYRGTDRRSANRLRRRTIQDVACAAIRGGCTNPEAAAVVRSQIADAKTTAACIAFYRCRFRGSPSFNSKGGA